MVLGFLRRKRSQGSSAKPQIKGPMGEFTEDRRYIPHPQELAVAEPLPQLLLEMDALEAISDEDYKWVMANRETWRPKRPEGQHGALLKDPVRLPKREFSYDAIIWNVDGKIYLADALTFALLRDSVGELTAKELVMEHLTGYIMELPENNPWRRALEAGYENADEKTKEGIFGAISAYYIQLAYLKKKGLLI